MKPFAQYDFPLGFRARVATIRVHRTPLMVGILEVSLNHTVLIDFVPAFDRHAPWPPELPENSADIRTTDQARRAVIALARFAVTPDEERAGQIEVLTQGEYEGVIFYIGPDAFERLTDELRSLSDRLSGVRDGVAVSRFGDDPLARLLNRIVDSGYLSQYQLRLLGRSSPGVSSAEGSDLKK